MRTETVAVLRGKSYVPSLARFSGTDELNISGQAEMVPCVTIAHILIQSSPIFQIFFKNSPFNNMLHNAAARRTQSCLGFDSSFWGILKVFLVAGFSSSALVSSPICTSR